ncbi:hypothetical protein NDU88_004807 [Pleurodeles waltl]|uniref:Uncharacterized protein n=1 Tax=Pleurodeles waltl TaxID=8319 RepID=A0AAV7W8J0_PLEWA|nr:hypothetical protein NDU88_004807 [Pleurodeles waltl]
MDRGDSGAEANQLQHAGGASEWRGRSGVRRLKPSPGRGPEIVPTNPGTPEPPKKLTGDLRAGGKGLGEERGDPIQHWHGGASPTSGQIEGALTALHCGNMKETTRPQTGTNKHNN